uniref:Inositol 2-dehydrogenase n=1 Tax=Pyramimonas obovata TaxID=1411642 RepID=A0A7S0QX93_9CHLO|mmetsp:Transcript_16375/g.35606  ORF Transcript_16375/g.35606 Transcript_16375/m.35606 type:complete len:353 (+) Transcript_16375:424-1482(+)|eukprot:CAMPEP_0118920762 /NCGR_PEP_ID=MMETSP1169-20130426/191_1 /TAXON_ID=36882 /ORGANISM="Pyramimonas obovata, Strain CCMP722" /LENGTH=352 /DNA_ID=CAMNT_0006861343 /DNA_START=407 /DNA_END=1465 /DNA_ORIENTATION=-
MVVTATVNVQDANAGSRQNEVCLALVGLGRAGGFHQQSMNILRKQARLKWVVDVNKKLVDKACEEWGCHGATSLVEVLEDAEVQGVIVASTTTSHYEQIMACLKAGKAVFTEKPVALNAQHLKEVIDYAKNSAIPFLVGFQRRFDRNFCALKAELDAGTVGAPRVIKVCSRDNPLPPLPYLATSSGLFHDMVCHDIDMIHYLTGQVPDSVFAIGHCYNKDIEAMNDIDTVVVTLSFPSGMLGTIDTSRTAPYGYDQRVEVMGEHGMAQAENEKESTLVVGTKEGFRTSRAKWTFSQRYEEAYLQSLEHFIVGMVRANKTDDPEQLQRHVILERVIAAAEESYKSGERVRLSK